MGFINTSTFAVLAGIGNFSFLEPHCAPGGEMRVSIDILSASVVVSPAAVTLNVTFRRCTYGEYYNAGDCIMCPAGSYSLKENADSSVKECETCPEYAEECIGDDMKLKKGHWRISAAASTISACILPREGCQGGWETGDASCSEGYEGPLCAVCSDGYFLSTSSYSCEACESNQSGVNPATVAILSAFLLFILFLVYCMRANDLSSVDEVITHVLVKFKYLDSTMSGDRLSGIHDSRRQKRKLFFAKIKIYLTMYQIISSMSFVLDLQFPVAFNEISAAFGILSMNFSQEFGVSCTTAYDYYDVLVVTTVLPLVVTGLIWATYAFHVWIVQLGTEHRVVTKAIYFYVFLFFTYLIFPGVTTIIFRSFGCDNVDPDDVDSSEDNYYLRSDYSISCSSDRYVFGVTWAAAMLLLYPLGIPALYLYLLYTARYAISHRDDATESTEGSGVFSGGSITSSDSGPASKEALFPLRFLFEYYRPEFWYWEVQ